MQARDTLGNPLQVGSLVVVPREIVNTMTKTLECRVTEIRSMDPRQQPMVVFTAEFALPMIASGQVPGAYVAVDPKQPKEPPPSLLLH